MRSTLGALIVCVLLACAPSALAASGPRTQQVPGMVAPAAARSTAGPTTHRRTAARKVAAARKAAARKLAAKRAAAQRAAARQAAKQRAAQLAARATATTTTITTTTTTASNATVSTVSSSVSPVTNDSAAVAVTAPTSSSAGSVTSATSASPLPTPAAPTASTAAPVLGTFGISTPQQASDWRAAGGTAVVIPVHWDQAQPTAGGPVSLASAGDSGDNVISEIQTARANGLAVYLEIDLQYPPQWVLSGVPEFVDQDGIAWTQPTLPGADVRDWIWSATGRRDVAAFVNGTLSALAPYLHDISGIRAGGGVYGELDFPGNQFTASGASAFWGYDAPAQTGTNLARGESASPLPGYVYGTGTSAQDSEWAHWYLGSLASWIKWYARLLRNDGWTGPTYVLSPSSGMRSNMTPESAAYEQQLASGTDWGVMMDSYDQVANVWPWSTWADDAEPFWHPGDTVNSDAAAWRKLLELAQARGLASHIMGENTGGGGAATIHQLMSGALAAGYAGVFYLNYSVLSVEGLTSDLVSQFDAYAP